MTHPILVMDAAGRVDGVGGLVVKALLWRGLPVRAMVRREDEDTFIKCQRTRAR